MEKLTVGYRCMITETDDLISKWYGSCDCILTERSSGEFSVMVLKEGTGSVPDKKWDTVQDELAWIDESNLKLVNKNVTVNLDFVDWYQEHEEEACENCGYFDSIVHDECPNCKEEV